MPEAKKREEATTQAHRTVTLSTDGKWRPPRQVAKRGRGRRKAQMGVGKTDLGGREEGRGKEENRDRRA